MARRGRKPKPAGLREQEGNRGHRPLVPDPFIEGKHAVEAGNIDPPAPLKGRRLQLWDEYIRKLPWLTFADRHTALAWVLLAETLEKGKYGKSDFIALRVYSNLLGLNPGARTDIASQRAKVDRDQPSKMASLIGGRTRDDDDEQVGANTP